MNKVVIKPIGSDNKNFITTSFVTKEPRNIKKFSSEGLAVSSSPNGAGARFAHLDENLNPIISPTNNLSSQV